MKTLLIVPAYNEAGTLENLISEIKEKCPSFDYLIINDCSTDNSIDILNRIGGVHVDAPVNLGIGGAVQTGYIYALENGYDIAVQVDGDGQHDVGYIDALISPIIDGNADIVIGSRFIDREGFQSTGARRTGIRFLSGLIKVMCGCTVRDVTSGFRAVNVKYIEAFANDYPEDYPEPEVIIAAALGGGIIKEVPVVMRERTSGTSSINLRKSVYYMIKVSIAIVMCRISLGLRKRR